MSDTEYKVNENNIESVDLEFLNFEVNMIYGFHLDPKKPDFDTWFLNKLEELKQPPDRFSGWTSFYRNERPLLSVLELRIEESVDCKIVSPPIWQDVGKSTDFKLTVTITTSAMLRHDGTGALTIRFEPKREANGYSELQTYGVRHVLATLLLSPRTVEGFENGKDGNTSKKLLSEIASFEAPKIIEKLVRKNVLSDSDIIYYSPSFLCFLWGMTNILDTVATSQNTPLSSAVSWRETKGTVSEARPSRCDAQTPYVYVCGTLSDAVYNAAFLESMSQDYKKMKQERRKYTKTIAAILGRWVFENNVHLASLDYWEKRGFIKDGRFLNTNMNSVMFTVFSGIATLSLWPERRMQPGCLDHDPMQMSREAFFKSTLRCLQSSRIRWHHVVQLSQEADDLIEQVGLSESSKPNITTVEKLLALRSKAAIYFEDPLAHMWEVVVGSEIARFLHENVIEQLEESVLRKLDMVKQILDEQISLVRVRDFLKNLKIATENDSK